MNIIYKVSGEEIEVLDLMAEAPLRQFAPKQKPRDPKTTTMANGTGDSTPAGLSGR